MNNIDLIKDFPILHNAKPYGKKLVYLDNAASSQKPSCVIQAMTHNLEYEYANVHRGVHYLANLSTIAFEKTRQAVKKFLNAQDQNEIILTTGATEGLNLLASSLGQSLREGDEIILCVSEHHSNIVPWHFLRSQKGCVIKWVNILENGNIDLDHYQTLLTDRTKIVSIAHISNVLGKINPIQEMAQKAHDYQALFICDGSQGAVHLEIDVLDLGIDFYVATGHKLYGPSGSGFVWGKLEHWQKMPPYRGGGEMIERVSKENVTYNQPPHRFEAGTPAITQVIGLGAALHYLQNLDRQNLLSQEIYLTNYLFDSLSDIKGVKIYGGRENRLGIVSFNIGGVHPHDMASYIDRKGIAVRAGHHCASPLMQELQVGATLRASLALYNQKSDIDDLTTALRQAQEFFA